MKAIQAFRRSTNRFYLMAFFIFLSCAENKQDESSKEAQAFPVITIEKNDVTTLKKYPAVIEGVVSSDVLAKVPGYITDVLVDEGDVVKKGQLLFKLETESLDQDAESAKARVDLAQVEVNRLIPLVEKDIISEVQLQSARASLQDAKSNYQSIQANIGYARIISPVNGVVGRINYRNGALVSPQDGIALTRVSQIDEVFVYFSMNEKDFLNLITEADGKNMQEKIKAFPEIELILSNGQLFDHKGKIEAISGDVDQETGTLSFRARFSNPEGILRNGGSGTVAVPSNYSNKILVPKVSTFERQNRRFVYVVEKDSIYEKAIEVQDENDVLYVLKNGMQAGTVIMGKGVNRVKDGEKIKPEPTSFEDIIDSYKKVFK